MGFVMSTRVPECTPTVPVPPAHPVALIHGPGHRKSGPGVQNSRKHLWQGWCVYSTKVYLPITSYTRPPSSVGPSLRTHQHHSLFPKTLLHPFICGRFLTSPTAPVHCLSRHGHHPSLPPDRQHLTECRPPSPTPVPLSAGSRVMQGALDGCISVSLACGRPVPWPQMLNPCGTNRLNSRRPRLRTRHNQGTLQRSGEVFGALPRYLHQGNPSWRCCPVCAPLGDRQQGQ